MARLYRMAVLTLATLAPAAAWGHGTVSPFGGGDHRCERMQDADYLLEELKRVGYVSFGPYKLYAERVKDGKLQDPVLKHYDARRFCDFAATSETGRVRVKAGGVLVIQFRKGVAFSAAGDEMHWA